MEDESWTIGGMSHASTASIFHPSSFILHPSSFILSCPYRASSWSRAATFCTSVSTRSVFPLQIFAICSSV